MHNYWIRPPLAKNIDILISVIEELRIRIQFDIAHIRKFEDGWEKMEIALSSVVTTLFSSNPSRWLLSLREITGKAKANDIIRKKVAE